MERPKKYEHPEIDPYCEIYLASDIDPLLDELEQLRADKKPIPTRDQLINALIGANNAQLGSLVSIEAVITELETLKG